MTDRPGRPADVRPALATLLSQALDRTVAPPAIGRVTHATKGWSQETWIVELETPARPRCVVRLADDPVGVARLRTQSLALAACSGTPVPAPELLWFEDGGALGRAASLGMGFVDGAIPVSWALAREPDESGTHLPDAATREMLMRALGSALAQIQAVAAPEGLRAPEGISAGQLTERSVGDDIRRLEESRLGADPVAQVLVNEIVLHRDAWRARGCAPVFRHGDFRIGNVVHQAGRVTGLLDWEFAGAADPYWDLGYSLLPEWGARRVSREPIVEAYEAATGSTVDRAILVDFQLLGYLRLIAITLEYLQRFEDDPAAPLRYGTLDLKLRHYLRDAIRLARESA